MPPTFQLITPIPSDRYQVVYKPTAADAWTNAPDGVHTTFDAANTQAGALVQAPTNAHQAMVLSPAVAYQKA